MSTMPPTEWKQEPESPPSYYEEAAWFTEDSFYQAALKLETEIRAGEQPHDDDFPLLDNLEQLVDFDNLIKDEPFLLDEKMLPLLEEAAPQLAPVPVHPVKIETVKKIPDTESLLKEFENIYDNVEFKYGALTPPQSPPSHKPVLTTLEPLLADSPTYITIPQQPTIYSVPEKQQQLLPIVGAFTYRPAAAAVVEYPVIRTPQPDIAHELAVVDELVRTRVEDMQWNSSESSGRSSPCGSSSCSVGDYSSDAEWLPEQAEESSEGGSPRKASRKRSKPYSRSSPEDRKVRKKEQNKNAATRYRMKKKAEVEEILGVEKTLQDKNDGLSTKITDLEREIKYLKGLMRDLFKAKGLIN